MGKFKRVCVFCGSNSGNRKIFSDAALDLATQLVCKLSSLSYIYIYFFPLLATHKLTNAYNACVKALRLTVMA